MTVGSQQAVIRFPALKDKAAGFSICTLLNRTNNLSSDILAENKYNTIVNAHLSSPYSKIYGTVGMVDMT